MKDKIFYVIAGHYDNSPGALASTGKYEHFYTTQLRDIIIKKLLNFDVKCYKDKDNSKLTEVISWLNEKNDNCYIIDLHFNDNNPKATGTEIFIHKNSSDEIKKIAENIVNNISKTLNIPVRTIVPNRKYKFSEESNRGKLGIIEQTLFKNNKPKPVFLIEICFLNENDLKKYIGNEEKVANAIINSFKI